MENPNQDSLVEIEFINQLLDIDKTSMIKLLSELRFKYFDSILYNPINVEENGGRLIWWIWDQGYEERTKKLIYGYFDIYTKSINSDQPINFRMICTYLPVYFIFLEMLVVIHSTIFDPHIHIPFLIEWDTKVDIITKSSSSTGKYTIPKPVYGSYYIEWIDYYHQRNNYAKKKKLRRYTFRDLSKDSGLSSGYLRSKHIGCPICIKKPRKI